MSKVTGSTFQQIWRRMNQERRRQAAAALFASPDTRDEQRQMAALMAKRLNLRPQKAAKLPPEKAVVYLAAIETLEEPLAALMVRLYLFTHHKPMLIMFLNEIQIPHADGVIADGNTTVPTVESLRAGLERLRAGFAPEEIEIYTTALVASDSEIWGNLEAALA